MPYKILLVRNNYTKKLDFKKGLDWFSKNTPLKIEIEEISTNLPTLRFDVNNDTFQGCVVDRSIYTELRKLIPENKYHCVVSLNGNKMNCVRVSYADKIPLYTNTDFVQLVKVTDDGLTFLHEIIHAFFHKLNRLGITVEDPMDKVVVNGVIKHYYNDKSLKSKESNRTIALQRLAPYWGKVCELAVTVIPITPVKKKYKYFSDSEIKGLKPELVSMLDTLRGICGFPFFITSGLRTDEHNSEVGGVESSAHTRGLAVDIAIKTSAQRYKIVSEALKMGFKRIGIGRDFVHLDISIDRPQEVIWHYY